MEKFDLVAAKMELLKRDMESRLNADLFRCDMPEILKPVRISIFQRAWWSTRGYLATLWLAICGRELVEPSEWD